jgi:hypothetical protein
MSHPQNKHVRFVLGKNKGIKRSKGYLGYSQDIEKKKEFIEKSSTRRRDTTKLCSCYMCCNLRRGKDKLTIQEKRFFVGTKIE